MDEIDAFTPFSEYDLDFPSLSTDNGGKQKRDLEDSYTHQSAPTLGKIQEIIILYMKSPKR